MKKKYDNVSRKKKCLLKYGFEHHLQNPEIRKKGQKRYTYNDIHFDSSYELALYIWLSDNNIEFDYQPNISIRYLDRNKKEHFYCPDFRIEGFLYELKGQQFVSNDGTWINPYNRNDDFIYEAKHQCCIQHQVKIICSEECEKYIKYIQQEYGKEYLQQFRNTKDVSSNVISKAELNCMYRNRKLENIPIIECNIYYLKNKELFIRLKELVEAFPKSYYRKLEAKGRKREIEAGFHIELQYQDLFKWINDCLPLLQDEFYKTSTKVTWILYGLNDFPKCQTCGDSEKFKRKNVNPFNGYGRYCSLSCAVSNDKTIILSKKTRLERYGNPNFVNVDKAKQTRKKNLVNDLSNH